MLMQPLLGLKSKRQIFLKKLKSARAPSPSTGPRLQGETAAIQGLEHLQKRRQSVRPLAEGTAQGRLGRAGAGYQEKLGWAGPWHLVASSSRPKNKELTNMMLI